MKILDRPMATASDDRFVLEKIPVDQLGENFADAVAAGLERPQKTLPCRFFYDERGSLLFEDITELEEYYPTRTERGILQHSAKQIAQAIGPQPELIELGSGSAAKTRLLIHALIQEHGSLLFRPIDISPTILESSSRDLLEDHPELEIEALAAEYDDALQRLADAPSSRPRLVVWLGSSIGNLTRDAACAFLGRVRSMLGDADRLLVGVDRRKDRATLERAYDDASGVTAAFNLNLLARANRELGANFELAQFEHRAVWEPKLGRVEMHLVSRCEQRVEIGEQEFAFDRGETIHTENSHKYSAEEIEQLAAQSGLRVEQRWHDPREWFELSLLQRA